MEIFALALGVAAVVAVHERKQQRRMFPPGVCEHCTQIVHFNWSSRIWVHPDGNSVRLMGPDVDFTHTAWPLHRSISTWGRFDD